MLRKPHPSAILSTPYLTHTALDQTWASKLQSLLVQDCQSVSGLPHAGWPRIQTAARDCFFSRASRWKGPASLISRLFPRCQSRLISHVSLILTLVLQWPVCPSSSSVGATARCGLWPVEKYLSIFPYLSPTLSIFSLPALEDLFLPLLSILSWVFILSLPVLEWIPFWASYPPLFSPGDSANLSFAPLSILLYFLLYSTLLVLNLSYFSIPHLHI
jgi:hypothetical protein